MGWTDWIREVERNRDVLERILALLLALAGLADRASGLPASRRLQVLGILGRGEAEARAFITGTVVGPSGEAGGTAFPADHAARLAAGFRALALLLGAMLARAGRLARWLRREPSPLAGRNIWPRKPAEARDRRLNHAARDPPPSFALRFTGKDQVARAASGPRRRGFRSPRERFWTATGSRAPT